MRLISPEEALAHIQALLDVKQERIQQKPVWPGTSDALGGNRVPAPDPTPTSGSTASVNAAGDAVVKRGE